MIGSLETLLAGWNLDDARSPKEWVTRKGLPAFAAWSRDGSVSAAAPKESIAPALRKRSEPMTASRAKGACASRVVVIAST